MKTLVKYQSKTGFTKKYAEWIAEKLACPCKEIAKVEPDELLEYDLIIHGGWIMGGMVNGLDKIRKVQSHKLIVFGVGFTEKEKVDLSQYKESNHLNDNPFFYYEGGMNPKKMGFIGRQIVKLVTKKKPEYVDCTNPKEIDELVELAKSM